MPCTGALAPHTRPTLFSARALKASTGHGVTNDVADVDQPWLAVWLEIRSQSARPMDGNLLALAVANFSSFLLFLLVSFGSESSCMNTV